MKPSKYYHLTVAIILSALLTTSRAIPEDEADPPASPPNAAPDAAPATGGGGSPSAPSAPGAPPKVIILDATTTISPEEIAMDEKIAELKVKQCMMLFGDCWALLKATKPYLKEETRMKICVRRVHGYLICEKLTDDQASQAKDETETELAKMWEEEVGTRNKQTKARKRKDARNEGKNSVMRQTD